MSQFVYFFSSFENMQCFIECLGLFVVCILFNEWEWIQVDESYILIVFFYGGGGMVGVVL